MGFQLIKGTKIARLILPQGFHDHDFIKMMKHERHGRNRIRLLAMYHLQLGKSFKAISAIVKSHWKTVQSWLRRFRNDGFEGLFESQRSGAPKKINTLQESALFDKINTLSESKTGGYITGKELHNMLLEEYGVKCALKTVYNTMHRLGFSWITSRSMHPKSNQEIQNTYKKNFQEMLTELLPKNIDKSNVDIWSQDESRVGQQGSLTRIWAKRGTRPRKVRQQQFISTYIYGAACHDTGESFALILPYANTQAMNKFLEELSLTIQGNRHIALLTDNAGWHTAKKLTVPSNITLIPLPPYAPELNAMEQVWEWIKNHYLSNQCYGVYEDIVTMACYAWNQLAQNVDLVKSIMYRDWVNTLR